MAGVNRIVAYFEVKSGDVYLRPESHGITQDSIPLIVVSSRNMMHDLTLVRYLAPTGKSYERVEWSRQYALVMG